jgi:hypothetical protein
MDINELALYMGALSLLAPHLTAWAIIAILVWLLVYLCTGGKTK